MIVVDSVDDSCVDHEAQRRESRARSRTVRELHARTPSDAAPLVEVQVWSTIKSSMHADELKQRLRELRSSRRSTRTRRTTRPGLRYSASSSYQRVCNERRLGHLAAHERPLPRASKRAHGGPERPVLSARQSCAQAILMQQPLRRTRFRERKCLNVSDLVGGADGT